jgi:threonine synthase
VKPSQSVCAILTGHVLKDPDAVVGYHTGALEGVAPAYANPPVTCEPTLGDVLRAMGE